MARLAKMDTLEARLTPAMGNGGNGGDAGTSTDHRHQE